MGSCLLLLLLELAPCPTAVTVLCTNNEVIVIAGPCDFTKLVQVRVTVSVSDLRSASSVNIFDTPHRYAYMLCKSED